MPASVGSISAELTADVNHFVRPMREAQDAVKTFNRDAKDMQDRLKSVQDAMRKAGLAASGMTAGFIAAGRQLIMVASEAEETQGKFDVSFGEMAETVNNWADDLAASFGRSGLQIRQFAADMQAVLAPMIGNREEAARMSKALVQLTFDLASFHNMAEDDVMTRLRAGMLGSTEAVEALAINLRESELATEAANLGWSRSVSTLDENQKMLLRFNAIMRQSVDAQGDVIRTADSWSNQTRRLQGNIEEFTASLGEHLLPMATQVITSLNAILGSFNALDESTKGVIATLGAGAGGAVATFALLTTTTWALVAAVRALGTAFKGALGPVGLALLGVEAAIAIFAGMELATKTARAAAEEEIVGIEEAFENFNPIQAMQRSANRSAVERAMRQIYDPILQQTEEFNRQSDALLAQLEAAMAENRRRAAQAMIDWGSGIDDLIARYEDLKEQVFEVVELADAAPDQLRIQRDPQLEMVRELELEVELREEILRLSRETLAVKGIDASQQVILNAAIEEQTKELERARRELEIGEEARRLAEYRREFERINDQAQLLALQLEAEVVPMEQLLQSAEALVEQVRAMDDGTVTWLSSLIQAEALVERIRTAMEGLSPEQELIIDVRSRAERTQALFAAELESRGDAIAALQAARDRLRDFAEAQGGLASASLELLGLYNSLGAQIQRLQGTEAVVHDDAVRQQARVNAVLEAFADELSRVNPVLGEFGRAIEFSAERGFSLNMDRLIGSSIRTLFSVIAGLFDGTARQIEERIRSVPEPRQDALTIAGLFADFRNIGANQAAQVEALRELQRQQQSIDTSTVGGGVAGGIIGAIFGGPLGLLIGLAAGAGGARAAAQALLADDIAATEEEIVRLEELIVNARVELIDALGIGADNLASGIQQALDAASFAEFSQNLEQNVNNIIRRGLIQRFIGEALAPQIEGLAQMVQGALLGDEALNMNQVRQVLSEITGEAEGFFEVLDSMGILADEAERTASAFEQMRNVPTTFRAVLRRWEAVSPEAIPLGMAGMLGPNPEPVARGAGMVVNVNLNGDTFGLDDLEERVKMAVAEGTRSASLAQHGLAGAV